MAVYEGECLGSYVRTTLGLDPDVDYSCRFDHLHRVLGDAALRHGS